MSDKEDPKGQNGTNAESSESDPCMEDGDVKPKRKTEFFEKYIDEISEKTGLKRKGVFIFGCVVLFAFILLIIVIALAAAWPRLPHKYQYPVCKEAACLRAAAQISESRDSTISPCNDLWSSMCGGWLRKNPLPSDRSIWNQKEQLVSRDIERVRNLIATLPFPTHWEAVEWKLKHLYQACMEVDNLNQFYVSLLTNIISDLDGWYILHNWKESQFGRGELVLKDLHVTYGATPFFEISVEPDPHTPGLNSIRISPSGLGLPDKSYYYRDEKDPILVAYKEFIRDTVIYLSPTTGFEATKFATDMFSYEKRIAEVTPNRTSLLNPISTYNSISLSELKVTNLIDFHDILQAMYPGFDMTENTEVIVTSLEYLSHISRILSSTDSATLNGYLFLTLVRKYVPFLSSNFTSAMDTFNAELFGTSKPVQRWEKCSQLVKDFMGLAVEILTEQPNESTHKIVNNTFDSILNVVKARIEKFNNAAISNNSRMLYQHLVSKLSSLRLQLGLPENVRNEDYLKNFYAKLKILKGNLFESVKNGVAFHKKNEEKLLLHSFPEASILKCNLMNEPRVMYSPSDNAIVVPRILVTEPVFENGFPSSVIYGRLGVEIAEAIVSAVLPYDGLWTSNKKILSPFHLAGNESIRAVQGSTKCLSNNILALNSSFIETLDETALKTLKHLSAVSIANEALLSSLKESNHIHQPTLEDYEDSALFFVTYSQEQCSEMTSQYRTYKNILDFELPQELLLHLAWDQLQEFSDSFSCSYSTNLQCDIF